MKKKKTKGVIAAAIIAAIGVVAGFILALYLSFMPNALNRRIYINRFANSESALESNISQADLEFLLDRILDYSYGSSNELQIEITDLNGVTKNAFIPDEITHYLDVRALFIKGRLLTALCAVVTLFCALYFYKKRKKIPPTAAYSALITLTVLVAGVIIIAIAASLDFYAAFVKFHEIFFDNDCWLLPWDSVSIITMPEEAFRDIVARTGITFVIILSLAFVFFSRQVYRIKKKKKDPER